MMKRGTDIPANTRLEYLYLEDPHATHQGEKAEDYTYYIENKDIEGYRPDRIHYVEKQLCKPISELLGVKYRKEPILYEHLDKLLERAFSCPGIDNMKKGRIARATRFTRTVGPQYSNVVGWEALSNLSSRRTWKKYISKESSRKNIPEERSYHFRGKEAKVSFVLDSARRHRLLPRVRKTREIRDDSDEESREEEVIDSASTEFNPSHPHEKWVINICARWKARCILDKLYHQHGCKKRPCRKPTQSGAKLRPNTQIILLRDTQGFLTGKKGKIISANHISGEKKNEVFDFDILMEGVEEKIIRNVPREDITTYYIRDSGIMKDILLARIGYKDLVEHLNHLFNPVIME
jgi:hypothetical protein